MVDCRVVGSYPVVLPRVVGVEWSAPRAWLIDSSHRCNDGAYQSCTVAERTLWRLSRGSSRREAFLLSDCIEGRGVGRVVQ